MSLNPSSLDEELGAGKKAAWLLARHLERMGAEKAQIPIKLNGVTFLVTIEVKKQS